MRKSGSPLSRAVRCMRHDTVRYGVLYRCLRSKLIGHPRSGPQAWAGAPPLGMTWPPITPISVRYLVGKIAKKKVGPSACIQGSEQRDKPKADVTPCQPLLQRPSGPSAAAAGEAASESAAGTPHACLVHAACVQHGSHNVVEQRTMPHALATAAASISAI